MVKKGNKIIIGEKVYLNARDTCKVVGISPPFLKQLTDGEEIPYIVFGKRKFFNLKEVEDSIQFKKRLN